MVVIMKLIMAKVVLVEVMVTKDVGGDSNLWWQ